ncbi:MAG: hypothetical protein OHK0022_03260 [Roseiflexaceae bacterium]
MFINCWTEFVDIHNGLLENGAMIWLETFDEREDRRIKDIYAALEQIELPSRREIDLNHYPLTKRLQTLANNICLKPLRESSSEERRWRTPDLPVLEPIQQRSNPQDIVIDNNNLLQLLNQLDPTGREVVDIQPRGALNPAAAQRCQELLTDYSSGFKIIIPIVVLEEFHRKAWELGGFQQALDVMKVIVADEGNVLYTTVFAFDELSIEVARAFVEVRSTVAALDLVDAIIVAHAVHRGCPLASGDQRIRAAATAFPCLNFT